MLLVVDNGSVYTNSIIDCLKEIKVEYKHLSFDKIVESDITNSLSIILSGRRKNDSMMNAINSKLIRQALGTKKPLLGICYGAEILAITLGGTIKKMTQSRYGIHKINVTEKNPLCSGIMNAFESHSYKVATLDPHFNKIASSDQCKFEIFQYGNQNIFGTQFHPEMSNDGKNLLKNFTSIK
ncbi:MAG: gamma-glutamyl-gamma-aminobutyrate hydrolase family protein [Thaumarchaeota archaeon]|nr:gamma-glutamyl-gamma-aminobutyrate hydrolase family protein [Nitrososphaerota archaeon]MDE1866390.1 gamma-glutamyl-gamma-aminobutyrate hydrolase family protein [Nitrososphaerota archaeon]